MTNTSVVEEFVEVGGAKIHLLQRVAMALPCSFCTP